MHNSEGLCSIHLPTRGAETIKNPLLMYMLMILVNSKYSLPCQMVNEIIVSMYSSVFD